MSETIIKSVFIGIAGDPSVGIPHERITVSGLYHVIEGTEAEQRTQLHNLRRDFQEFFADLTGEKPTVTFDFEEAELEDGPDPDEEAERHQRELPTEEP